MEDPIDIAAPSGRECLTLGFNLSCLNDRRQQSEQLFRSIEYTLGIPFLHHEQSTKSAEDITLFLDKLFEHAKSTGRMCLLVAGGLLDEHISTLVLASLARGLDVYLLHDILVCGQQRFEHIFMQRLHQAGAVPTTLGQCLFHWELEADTDAKRTSISELAKQLAGLVS